MAKAKEEIAKAQNLVEISAWSSAHNTDKPITNEAEELVQLEYTIITALDEIKEGQTYDQHIEVSKVTLDNLEDTVMCVIKNSEAIQKKNTLLQDALQKSKGKHDETDSTLLEALRTKEEENKKLKTQVTNLIKVQEDLKEVVMNIKI